MTVTEMAGFGLDVREKLMLNSQVAGVSQHEKKVSHFSNNFFTSSIQYELESN
jgi:hypothetical protein